MDLKQLLEVTFEKLKRSGCTFALCGGICATLYREQPRFTGDVDFLLCEEKKSRNLAKRLIEEAGLTHRVLRESAVSLKPGMNKRQSPIIGIMGRHKTDKFAPGLDFLFTTLPWGEKALSRAQQNCLDFDCGAIPSVTVEDLIVAKLSALKAPVRGVKDLDDLRSIFSAKPELDLAYLSAELDRLCLSFPRTLENDLPRALQVASKRLRTRKKLAG